MADEIRAGRNPLDDNGALGLVATPEQLEGLHRIQALMSLLEGHGDVTMDRAGAADIPSAARFAEVLRQRRKQAHGLARLLQQLIGIEAKLRQYEEGERFIAAVEDVGRDRAARPGLARPGVAPVARGDPRPAGWIARVGAAPRRPVGLTAADRRDRRAGRPDPVAGLLLAAARSPPPATRWSAACRAVPTRWPCWCWPWRPAVG